MSVALILAIVALVFGIVAVVEGAGRPDRSGRCNATDALHSIGGS